MRWDLQGKIEGSGGRGDSAPNTHKTSVPAIQESRWLPLSRVEAEIGRRLWSRRWRHQIGHHLPRKWVLAIARRQPQCASALTARAGHRSEIFEQAHTA